MTTDKSAASVENIPDLTIVDNGDGTWNLEQTGGQVMDYFRVAVHPLHVRHLAEKFGFLPGTVPAELAAARSEISRLQRALVQIQGRVTQLGKDLLLTAQGNEDLSYELDAVGFIEDLLDFVIADFTTSNAVPADVPAVSRECPQGQQRDSVGTSDGRQGAQVVDGPLFAAV